EAIRNLQQVWDNEPSPAQVIWAALFYNGINDVPLDTWRDQQRYSRFAPLVDVRVEIDQRRWDEEWVGFAFGPGEEASVNNIDRQQLDAEYYTDVEFRVLALWDIGEIL